MEELLKKLGYTPEQIKAILDEMANSKIYTSSEENADIRLKKLGDDIGLKDTEISDAKKLIDDLKLTTKGNEDAQTKITDYETENNQLKEENLAIKKENAIKFKLLEKGAKPEDIDYLIFKIQNENKEIKYDEKEGLKGVDFEEISKQYSNNFVSKEDGDVDVKELGKSDKLDNDNNEPKNLEEALKQHYDKKMNKDEI